MADISSDVTYSSLIDAAANIIRNKISSGDYSQGTFATFSSSLNIHGSGHTITNTVRQTSGYSTPAVSTIKTDITNFCNSLGIPTGSSTVTIQGAITFFFAINYFMEKALIRRYKDVSGNYHIHYQAPSASYSKLPMSYADDTTVTSSKINDIYSQLSSTDMMSTSARKVTSSGSISCSSCSSSCSSSSCSSSSSSSCSSSAFIAYFKL